MGEPGSLDYVYIYISNLFVDCNCLSVGLAALKHTEKFFTDFESFSSHFECPGFDWYGKSSLNTHLIFLANITSACIMADGIFLLRFTL